MVEQFDPIRRLREHVGNEMSDAPTFAGREIDPRIKRDPLARVGLGVLSAMGLMLQEGGGNAARAASGASMVASAKFNPFVRAGLNDNAGAMSGTRISREAEQGFDRTAGQGNLFQRFVAANEEAARGDEIATGFINAAYDPSNVTMIGGPLAGAGGKLGKVGKALKFADDLQALPFKPVEKLIGKGFQALARGVQQPALGITPGLADSTNSKIAGGRTMPPAQGLADLIGAGKANRLAELFPAFDEAELVRIMDEGQRNQPAVDFAEFINTNWDRAKAGQITEDDIIGAYVPTILSQRRGAGKPSVHLGNSNREVQLGDKYPALLGKVGEGLTIGGEDAGKHRPEDLAALMLDNTDEGRDLASALKYGDPQAIQTAMDEFNKAWPDAGFFPGPGMNRFGGERGALTKMGDDEGFRSVAQMINRMATGGATGDEVAQVMRDWTDATSPKPGKFWQRAIREQGGNPLRGQPQIVDRVANGKSGFLTTNLGGPSATFDVRVEKAMRPGATVDDYTEALGILFPGDDPGLAHHKFWDAQSINKITGEGGQTPHLGLAEGVKNRQAGKLFPAPMDRITPGLADELNTANTYDVAEVTDLLSQRPARSHDELVRQRYHRDFLDGRATQDIAAAKEQARSFYAQRVPSMHGFEEVWEGLTSRLEDLKTISMGVGDAESARAIGKSGLGLLNGFRLRGVRGQGGEWPLELVDSKAKALGLDKGARHDEAVAFAAARGVSDPREATREYARYFLDIEADSFEMIGAGNPRSDAGALMPTYAAITEGQPALGQMGGGIHLLFDPDATDYVASLHHPFMMASKTVLPMHKFAAKPIKGVWGPGRQAELAAAAGRPEVQRYGPEGQWGVSGSPLIGSPAASSALRAASLIATHTGALREAANDPERAVIKMLRGNTLQQRGDATSLTRNLAGDSSQTRSEAMLINPQVEAITGVLVKGNNAKTLRDNVAAAREMLARFGRPDTPIYVAYGPEGAVPGVFELTPEGPVRSYLNKGREALIDRVRELGMDDYGATPGGRIASGLLGNLTGLPGSSRIGQMGSGSLIGAVGGALTADDEESRREAALRGAAIGAGVGLGATTGAGNAVIKAGGAALRQPLGNAANGAAVGALGGGAYGAMADDEDRGRGALKGALFGAGAGAALRGMAPELGRSVNQAWKANAPSWADDTIVSPKALEIAHRVAAKAQEDASKAAGVTLANLPRAVDDAWRAQVVNTFRGLGLDAASVWLLVKDFGRDYGVNRQQVKSVMGELIDNFDDPDPIRRLGAFGDDLDDWGLTEFIDKETGLQEVIGTGFGADELQRHTLMSTPQRMLAGASFSLMNLRDWMVPVVGPVAGAVRGAYAPYLDNAYRTLNNFQHAAPRIAFWQAALERDLPQAVAEFADEVGKTGIDLNWMKGGGPIKRADLELYLTTTYKGLQPQEIEKFGELYQEKLNVTAMKDADRISHIFGDFREKNASPWKLFLGRVFPFSRYAMAYAPVFAEMVKRNPVIAAGALGGLGASALAASRNDEPPWQGGTIPISTETPGLGLLARARLGGQQGTWRVDPIGNFTGPISAQTFAGLRDSENATPYDRAAGVGEMAGLSPHPLIGLLAGITGQSNKTVTPASRTAPIEQAAELVPGMPTIPSLQGTYLSAKERLTGQGQDDFDPVARRFAELVELETGKPLQQNYERLEAMGDIDDPLWRQARQEVRLSNLLGGLMSNLTPVSSQAQTAQNAAYQSARNGRISDTELAALQLSDPVRFAIERQQRGVNDRFMPREDLMYRNANTRDRDYAINKDDSRFARSAVGQIIMENRRKEMQRKDR